MNFRITVHAAALALALMACAPAFGGDAGAVSGPDSATVSGIVSGIVSGKVTFMGKPLEGAGVYAYKDPKGMFRQEPEAPPATADGEGRFSMSLPTGKYYIAAIKKFEGDGVLLNPGDLYCFSGRNPLAVDPSRPVDVTLSMVIKPDAKEDLFNGEKNGGVEGVVSVDGQPMDGVVLYVYLDANGQFRGPAYYTSTPTGVDGAFRMKMSEGTYYIIARKRIGGQLAGPLKDGDFFGYPDINPVVITAGWVRRIDIPMVMKAEGESGADGRVMTGISGVIRAEDGSPAGGVHVFVYKSPEMVNRPDYISGPSRKDGSFEVSLPLGGVYYLLARDTIGKPVEPGQMWGRYDGSPDHSVEVETGQSLKGLEITVSTVE